MKRKIRILSSFLLVLLMVLSLATSGFAESDVKKDISSKTIAIVYDNSGSMAMSNSKAWCQATYAMEVFASMMNSGDALHIFPMNEITINGKSFTYDNPLTLVNATDAALIESINNTQGIYADTHIESVTAAYEKLKSAKSDEKWLILLTDGAEFYEDGKALGVNPTREILSQRLSEYCDKVNVLYLGIKNDVPLTAPTITGKNVHDTKIVSSEQVPETLSAMCNMIFGRDELPRNSKFNDGTNLFFDVSMSKLILFIQGAGISNISLKDTSGKNVGNMVSSANVHYVDKFDLAEKKASVPDTTLQGTIATLTDIPAGNYVLDYDYTGKATASIYYEPNVDLQVLFMDEYGEVVDPAEELYSGDYTLGFGLMDCDTGKLTDSELLGESTQYKLNLTRNGEELEGQISSKAGYYNMTLNAEDELDFNVSADFLSGYHVDKDAAALGWPFGGIHITTRPAGDLRVVVTGGSESYDLAHLNTEAEYYVEVYFEGEKLTGSDLQNIDLKYGFIGSVLSASDTCENDHYTITCTHPGEPSDTQAGDYILAVQASRMNEDGVLALSNEADVTFAVEDPAEKLEISLTCSDTYYIIPKILQGKPIVAHLLNNGKPLTDEQLAQVVIKPSAEGLQFDWEPMYGDSACEIRINDKGANAKGKYDVQVRADGKDVVGRTISADDEIGVTLQPFGRWVKIVAIILILLLLLILIWLYLRAKVLPKAIEEKNTRFTVDGAPVKGKAKVALKRQGKNGTIEVVMPKYGPNPFVKGSIRIPVIAESSRSTKSASRTVRASGMPGISGSAVNSVRIGSTSFKKNDNGKWELVGGNAQNGVSFLVPPNSKCEIHGTTPDNGSGETDFTMVTTLEFK